MLVAQHVETINRAAKAAKLMASRVPVERRVTRTLEKVGWGALDALALALALAPTGER